MTQTRPSNFKFRSLAKLWPWLSKSRKLILVSVILVPVTAAVEAVTPIVIQRAIDLGILSKSYETLLKWSLIYISLVLFAYVSRVFQSIANAAAVHRMIFDMRQSLISHVLRLPSTFHDKQLSGALATRATSDFDSLSESLNQGVLTVITDFVTLAACVVGMFVLSPKLAFFTMIILPIVWCIVSWFSKKLNRSMLDARKKIALLNGYTQEAFAAVSAIKLLAASKNVGKKYHNLNTSHRDAQMNSVFYDAFMFATLEGVSSLTLGLALYLFIRTFSTDSNISAGIIVGFVQYVQQIFEPLKNLGTKMAMLQGAFTSIDRIFGLLDRHEKNPGTKSVSWSAPPKIEFQNVSFKYDLSSDLVLHDISFTIPPKSSLAIVGATGSGKSTIVKLICKMYYGHQGKIFFDRDDINDLSVESLTQNLGIVPQDIVLFDGSISFNISLGDPKIDLETIKRAAAITGADRFINSFSHTYDHKVSEGGSNLSHGQKQLIVFTRALLRQPSVIVLDEATSSVDPASERLIQDSLSRMLKDRTVIIIAHRLNTIEKCDHVLVIDRGRILEEGSPSELIDLKAHFYQLQYGNLKE